MSTIPASSKTEMITLRMAAEDVERLNAVAARFGLSRAAVIRLVLRGQLENVTGVSAPLAQVS